MSSIERFFSSRNLLFLLEVEEEEDSNSSDQSPIVFLAQLKNNRTLIDSDWYFYGFKYSFIECRIVETLTIRSKWLYKLIISLFSSSRYFSIWNFCHELVSLRGSRHQNEARLVVWGKYWNFMFSCPLLSWIKELVVCRAC